MTFKTSIFRVRIKNNLLTLTKRFAEDYQNVLDRNGTVPLQSEDKLIYHKHNLRRLEPTDNHNTAR